MATLTLSGGRGGCSGVTETLGALTNYARWDPWVVNKQNDETGVVLARMVSTGFVMALGSH